MITGASAGNCAHLGESNSRKLLSWGLHSGTELDFLVVRGQQCRAFEIKFTDSPRTTRSMHMALALEALQVDSLDVIHAGQRTFPMAERIRAVGLVRLEEDLVPLE